MPAASNGGEERVAHTGSAGPRPAASSSRTRSAGSLPGQPPASRALPQAWRARSAGTSLRNGLSGMTLINGTFHNGTGLSLVRFGHRYRVTSTSVPPSRPVASSGTITYPSPAVTPDPRAHTPHTHPPTPPPP